MIVLGIETSCDETAAAVVTDDGNKILANVIQSQNENHRPYGGVVPEIAARAHLSKLDSVIKEAVEKSQVGFKDVDAVAVTAGPGLVGGLIVGTMTAKAIAKVHKKPVYEINHLEGHALTPRLTDEVKFPYLTLLVSGGHTQVILVRGVGDYQKWATTIDDALGEAFDKVARLLNLDYPGGPQVEKYAENGDPNAFRFPRPLKGQKTLNMSFSGLKTAVRKVMEKDYSVSDVCASFQNAVADILEDRVERTLDKFQKEFGMTSTLVVAGGVASNNEIRKRLGEVVKAKGWEWVAPPPELCTDNAAMIAWAAVERIKCGIKPEDEGIKPRWPLDPINVSVGGGKKGPKA